MTAPRNTGAIDLDLEQLLSSGALEGWHRPAWWQRLLTWLTDGSPWEGPQ